MNDRWYVNKDFKQKAKYSMSNSESLPFIATTYWAINMLSSTNKEHLICWIFLSKLPVMMRSLFSLELTIGNKPKEIIKRNGEGWGWGWHLPLFIYILNCDADAGVTWWCDCEEQQSSPRAQPFHNLSFLLSSNQSLARSCNKRGAALSSDHCQQRSVEQAQLVRERLATVIGDSKLVLTLHKQQSTQRY